MNVTQDTGLIAAKTRLTNIKADIADLKLRQLNNELVELSTVNEQWNEQAGRVRAKMLAVPVRLAGMLSGREYEPSEIEAMASIVVNEALTELAEEFHVKGDDEG